MVAITPKLPEVVPQDVEIHALLDTLSVPVEGGLRIKPSRGGVEEGSALNFQTPPLGSHHQSGDGQYQPTLWRLAMTAPKGPYTAAQLGSGKPSSTTVGRITSQAFLYIWWS